MLLENFRQKGTLEVNLEEGARTRDRILGRRNRRHKTWRCETCPHEGISEPLQPKFQILITRCRLEVFLEVRRMHTSK